MNSPTILSQLGRLTWAQGNGLRDSLRNLFTSWKLRVLPREKKPAMTGAIHLPQGSVHRLDTDEVREVKVLRGTVWLTAAPGEGDIVLHAGASFSPQGRFPVLIESLEEKASLLIHR